MTFSNGLVTFENLRDILDYLTPYDTVKELLLRLDYIRVDLYNSDSRWLAEVFAAMIAHQGNVQVQEAACLTLSSRLASKPELINLIGEGEDHLLPLHGTVLSALNIHAGNVYVFRAACEAIYQLSIHSSDLQKYLYYKGASASIIREMKNNTNASDVIGSGCKALRALGLNNPYQHELMFVAEDVLSVIYETLKTFREETVLQECIGLLVCLATDLPIVLHQCMAMKIPDMILKIADNNFESQRLVEITLEAIALFCSSEEQQLLHIDCVRSLRRIMEHHVQIASIQIKVCVIMQLINADIHFISNSAVFQEIVDVLIQAMSSDPDNNILQIEGCIAIYLMFTHKGSKADHVKRYALEKDVPDILFEIIEDGRQGDKTAILAKDALKMFSSSQHFKDALLQKACLSKRNKCAEFMIEEQEASLDVRPNLPLCIAVETNNKKLVEMLLNYDSTNASEALALCLDLKNYEIAGVLLRYIGFEQESGYLIWGNLNLKDLRPELIENTLEFQVKRKRSSHRGDRSPKSSARPPSRMELDQSPPLSRNNSFTENMNIDEEDSSSYAHARNIESISGPVLPYNRDDPRLSHNDTIRTQKHFIPFSPRKDFQHHPQQPNTKPILPEAGHLLPPIDKCPSFGKRSIGQICSSPSDGAINDIIGPVGSSIFYTPVRNIRSNTSNDLNHPVNKIPKLSSPPVQRRSRHAFSCINQPNVQPKNNDHIKTLDISHNDLTDIDQLVSYPSLLVKELLSNLQTLHLSENALTEFSPHCCEALSGLKVLNLAKNKLVDFPYEILHHKNIETIDLSKNLITTLHSDKVKDTFSLLKLDISHNKLKSFPNWIGASFPRMTKLSFRGNEIREIPDKSYDFRSIKEINLSHNDINRISPHFFRSCQSLEKIDLSHNRLESLPDFTLSTLSKLFQVKLSHNCLKGQKPFYIPKALLAIPSLTMVDLSYNSIMQMPDPSFWSAKGLKELNLANNRIQQINLSTNSKDFWPEISRLNLSNNNIRNLPAEIGFLDSLVSFDVSHNQINELPNEIGLLKKVFELNLKENPLKHDPALQNFRPQDIIGHHRYKLKNAVPYRRMKLMLVGYGGRGKSSLLRQLVNMKHPTHNVATVGVELRDWELKPPSRFFEKSRPTFTLNTWDFAGQEEFYSTHQYFLSSRALYLAVFDASQTGTSELDNLRPWLLNIQASAPAAMVILVGTHIDRIPREVREEHVNLLLGYMNKFVCEPGLPKIEAKFVVNCMRETSAMEKLREKIYSIVSNFKYEGQQIIEQMVPNAYVLLEKLLCEEVAKMHAEKLLPIRKWDQIVKMCQDGKLVIDDEELKCALKFLKETGSIMHFSDASGTINNLYFIDPQWLCQMMARVVTIREINPWIDEHGVLPKEKSSQLFPNDKFPLEFLDRYFKLLQMFEIVLPLSDKDYLVTARVPQSPPDYIPKHQKNCVTDENVVTRRYRLPYFPSGFWTRLITRILVYQKENLSSEPNIIDYWQTGMYMSWDVNSLFLITTVPEKQNIFDIYVPMNQHGFMVLGVVVDLVDNLIEEWYPGLSDSSYSSRSSIQRLVPCNTCRGDLYGNCHYFTVAQCTKESHHSDIIECPQCGPRRIRDVAPDVVFADIDQSLIVERINIDENGLRAKKKKLGDGAFSTVYKINVEGENIAAKVYIKNGGISANRLLRQEVDILTKIQHPCLISITGVSLRPRMLLLEYAPLGNLDVVLKSGRAMSRGIQHRIGLQIIEGLAYLHDRGIVYRDLKPSNVLVFSLSIGMHINVKLSDYGISQWSSILGLTAVKGTAGYQAPEVSQRNISYDGKVDIVSFGVTFYEIVTGGMHPYGDVPFQSQLDAMILMNKPINSISKHGCAPWTDIENLIQQCLHPNPEFRPSASKIRDALLDANIVCLKREVAISREQSVECTVSRKFTTHDNLNKIEVWAGSGETEQSQISWFTLGADKKQTVQGMFVKEGRILCMEPYKHFMMVGTNKGYVIVFHADTKKRHNVVTFNDAVLSMKVVSSKDSIVLGLASGDLHVAAGKDLLTGNYDRENPYNASNAPIKIDAEIPKGPIACLATLGNTLLCGYGQSLLELRMDSGRVVRQINVGSKAPNIVSALTVTKKRVFVTCREDHQIKVYETSKLFISTCITDVIDCHEILQKEYATLTPRDCRPISMAIVESSNIWIGTESGHVIILDTNKTKNVEPLNIISRSKSTVRSITVCPRLGGGSQSVVTSGQGFWPWSSPYTVQKDNKENLDGYCLVWDSELPKQKKHLLAVYKKREDEAKEMSENSTLGMF
ncbi:leucine-rich repeat serine/threonine-protein kinase 2-like isoform X2 [Clytia hemisphaerica]|uniref:leucine-rich repeat serine/threonine-protein kinase 2-like isoform X2 n=1 Tax=Clytia hemisphaerica TaxID=252671 RepID=UPI0034D6A061